MLLDVLEHVNKNVYVYSYEARWFLNTKVSKERTLHASLQHII